MSELNFHPTQEIAIEDLTYARFVEQGLDAARHNGFDLQQSLAANFETIGDELLAARQEQVLQTATTLAEQAQLDAAFFERPANTVMLLAAADSWIDNEARAAQAGSPDQKLAAEREMLSDVVLIMAGEQSGVVRDLVETNPAHANKYRRAAEVDPDETARMEFLDNLCDDDLAEEVTKLFADDSEGSFLAEQRAKYGLSAATEQPFRVKVLKMAEHRNDFVVAGQHEATPWPKSTLNMSDEQQAAYAVASDAVTARLEAQNSFSEPYVQAHRQYQARFAAKYGALAPAFVDIRADGSVNLVIRAAEAYTMINYFAKEMPMPTDGSVASDLAIARHEYGHTQRQFMTGAHNQIGLLIEERKAEYISGDKNGYQDVKYLLDDLSYATGTNLVEKIDTAIKTEDPLSALACDAANGIGLRNLMLLLAAKPLPYEKSPEHAKQFADLRCIQTEGDVSQLDAIIHETLERRGDAQMIEYAGRWAVGRATAGFTQEALTEWISGYRRAHGLARSAPYLRRAVEAAFTAP